MKDNNYIVYNNYLENDSIAFNFSSFFSNVNLSRFNSNSIRSNRKLTGDVFNFLINKYYNTYNEHFKKLLKSEYIEIKNDSTSNKITLFAIGKQRFNSGVDSYLVLKTDKIDGNRINKSIILFNTKKNILCSIVELSDFLHGIDDGAVMNSYYKQSMFTQIQFMPTGNYFPEDLFADLKINFECTEFIFYSQYQIDKDGFIKLIN